ncbi:hypothetical protein [Saccharothrix algeriensis]|uniref:Uncharacterized protein n=1 Tax=Saccharothrix algeriensis TaxID=173560 RepID=A0A8T8I452_9PSEU|nr:hypothetical protein [Saccharothrix algeriensis]MBM7811308.1 hypothetical protein [Saccharothrix algeriensis]QTR05200.1 hypothetical protein J7S33_11210 [Saccharothrix algeriensis]
MGDPNAWYYCLAHQKAEKGVGCRGGDRMGPYPDEATARRALELARQRTEAENEADREWEERG